MIWKSILHPVRRTAPTAKLGLETTMLRRLARWLRDENGAIAPILVLALIPIIGGVALGGEVSSWYMKQRQVQNASDAAALAAAANNTTTNINSVPSYKREAFAAAGQYGYQTAANGDVVVTPSVTDCPGSAPNSNDCYKVEIKQRIPLYLAQVVGFSGNTAMADGRRANWVTAVALAKPPGTPAEYCMVGLSTTGTAFRINGGNSVDFNSCSVKSNSGMTCNGANSDMNMLYGDSGPTSSSTCGHPPRSNQSTLTDPYALLNFNPPIPAVTCNTGAITDTTVVTISAIPAGGVCGTAKLTADIVVSAADTTLTIYNGALDLNGHTITTSGSGSLSIILTGSAHSSGSWSHTIKGSGGIDITAPTTGTAAVSGGLKGVAIMQDKRMNGSKDQNNIDAAGNQPSLTITGLIYAPNGDFTIKGAISHRTGNLFCIAVVANNILASGTGSIYANSSQDCHVNDFLTGLDVTGTTLARQALVQ